MEKKIKIIDLLNKIANGEEVPEKIKFQNCIYTTKNPVVNEYRTEDGRTLTENHYMVEAFLTNEVEILDEEDEFEDIEELTCNEYDFEKKAINQLIKNQKKIIERLKDEK